MATFTIKRGDTAPPLEISLSIAGTSPKEYWKDADDRPDNRNNPTEIFQVRFIMRGADNKIVGATLSNNYTGIAQPYNDGNKTVLTYYWKAGDTAVAGTYQGEFEVIYGSSSGKKRTFPSTAGDTLVINVTADLNDE